jgi:hypothetical protein
MSGCGAFVFPMPFVPVLLLDQQFEYGSGKKKRENDELYFYFE